MTITTLVCFQAYFHFVMWAVLASDPRFDVPVVNVTVVAGETAVLPCSVEYLGKYQVVWMDKKLSLLTLENRRVIDDARVSVERPYVANWNLHIRDVTSDDQGLYMCQINTDPVKIKQVVLYVQVPSKIIDHLSSDDMELREGDTVLLVCNVTGVPHPNVTWYRLSKKGKNGREKIGMSGEVLKIRNISRYCDDIYECVAFNGVPPTVSRQIKVSVQFPPEVRVRNKRMGQEIGKMTILECTVTASPLGATHWEKNSNRIENSWKYRAEAYNEDEHTITLSLRIRAVEISDFGEYTCVASNHLGSDQEKMILYEHNGNRIRPASKPDKQNGGNPPLLSHSNQTPPRNRVTTPMNEVWLPGGGQGQSESSAALGSGCKKPITDLLFSCFSLLLAISQVCCI
ncbi:opioid-binding protein/cell adhesion molecule homolog [Octopus sinensis]|nr:opioid-binding protein/cell adhesion molecule homolog [Octopus sinensis]